MIKRDGANTSLWQKNIPAYKSTAKPDRTSVYDVIIIGGGITGINTALLLQDAGLRCLVLEGASLCFGTTGGTTAHINTLLDTPYATIAKNFNREKAKTVANAVKDAVGLIKRNVTDYSIECEFQDADAFLFSQDKKQDKELEDIASATRDAGITLYPTDTIPLPVLFRNAIRVPGQAKFHPVKYVMALAKAFEEKGGIILQNCRALGINENAIAEVLTNQGQFKAQKVIYATHTPMGVNLVHLRCQPYRSYAMAVTLKEEAYPEHLSYDMYDPYHYYRTQLIDEKKYLIVGGYDHKTGKEENTEKCFEELEAHIRSYFKVSRIMAQWSSQYFEPADGLPYIGHLPGHTDLLYTAAGYGGNGITYSHVAALVFKSIFLNHESPYIDLFNPNRIKPVAGFKNFIAENIEVVSNFISKLGSTEKLEQFADIAPGEGKIARYEDQKIGLFKDDNGQLHAVNTTCKHLACTVAWNGTEQSWDCSCHGARYDVDGNVLTGPADRPLDKVDIMKAQVAEK